MRVGHFLSSMVMNRRISALVVLSALLLSTMPSVLSPARAGSGSAWLCKGSRCKGYGNVYPGQPDTILHFALPQGWKISKYQGSLADISTPCGPRSANTVNALGYSEVGAKTSAMDVARDFQGSRGGSVGRIRGGAFGITEYKGVAWGAVFAVGPVKRGRRYVAAFWFASVTNGRTCQGAAQAADNRQFRLMIKRAYAIRK